jgi:hypothetical protein
MERKNAASASAGAAAAAAAAATAEGRAAATKAVAELHKKTTRLYSELCWKLHWLAKPSLPLN